eukprot:2206284-Pleurochrysis_carterae.AAC.1
MHPSTCTLVLVHPLRCNPTGRPSRWPELFRVHLALARYTFALLGLSNDRRKGVSFVHTFPVASINSQPAVHGQCEAAEGS